MTITSQAQPSSFAEFLADPDHVGDLMHLFWSLGDSGILFPSDADELINALGASQSDADLLSEAEELAEKLCETVTVLRRMIADYFRHRGAIDQVTNAVEAFVAAPTGPNHRALETASYALASHPIPMSRALKRKLAPFLKSRSVLSALDFGTLYWITISQLGVDLGEREAA
ncbi:hypothetical protein FJ976_17285 [Mesorhizobium sp. B1-1-9]|uniref:hypothetical protein n=1 Tax=Mesorhizobium sp. B1-1-9 TaxID=2589975 RepID=UPI00112D61CD|nr:hypothetical protein [Mesorhizobium sp. B1-1-9]TPN49483.1 hypothetical protein FJ976_17285 [Mesorhizobium sp. B1-1-9]